MISVNFCEQKSVQPESRRGFDIAGDLGIKHIFIRWEKVSKTYQRPGGPANGLINRQKDRNSVG
jgi:hypothetical protein